MVTSHPSTGPAAPSEFEPSEFEPFEFDWQQLKQLAGEDTAFEAELLQMFLRETQSELKELEKAIACRSVQAIENIAHSLRGASANVGAIALAAAARQLETLARSGQLIGQLTDAKALLHQMSHHCQSIQKHLRSRL